MRRPKGAVITGVKTMAADTRGPALATATAPLRSAPRLPRARVAQSGLLAALALLAPACSSPLKPGSRQRIEAAERWRDEIQPRPYRPAAQADAARIGEPATVEDFVAVALARNPSIRAAEARVRRLAQRAPQAGSLDDPMLTVAPFGEMAETASGRVGAMTSLSQRVPLTSKLDARARIAELDARQAEAELQQVRLRVAGDTRRAYWAWVSAARSIQTTRESRALLLQLRDVAAAHFRAGLRGQQDVLRAAAELGALDSELLGLGQRRDTAAAMLRQLIDAPADAPLPEPQPADPEAIAIERDALLARAIRVNPALRRVAERMRQFEERQRLAKLSRWPDLTVSVSYNLVDDEGLSPVANGRDQWWVGFGINIPLWAQKYNAAEREALLGRLEAASDSVAERNRVAFEVEDALLRLQSQRQMLALLNEQVLPDARGAVEAAGATYRSGEGEFLALIDNWRRLLSYEIMEHQVASSVGQALADLEQAVGANLREVGDAAAPADGDGHGGNEEFRP